MEDKIRSLETPYDILRAALKKEKASYRYYDNLLKDEKVHALREFLEDLRNEEYKHIRRIEKKLSQMELG